MAADTVRDNCHEPQVEKFRLGIQGGDKSLFLEIFKAYLEKVTACVQVGGWMRSSRISAYQKSFNSTKSEIFAFFFFLPLK